MKKTLIIIPLVFLLLILGCGKGEHLETPVSFYYPSAKITYGDVDGFISSEERDCTGLSMRMLIESYFRGPLDDTLRNPFPEDIRLIQCSAEGKSIQLTLSDSYAALSGAQLSVANACIAKTLTDYYGVESVTICCESKDLDGERLITLTAADLVFFDQSTGSASNAAENTTQTQ